MFSKASLHPLPSARVLKVMRSLSISSMSSYVLRGVPCACL
jgi:hypothetical protein